MPDEPVSEVEAGDEAGSEAGATVWEREQLARQQAELVRALVVGGPIPEGFDTRRVGVAADALLRKRAGEVAWHIPHIRSMLGDRFVELFADWARGRERSGSAAEARAFTAHLVERGEIDPTEAAPHGGGGPEVTTGRPWWKRLLG
ncbi:hypothetical protein [Millisia brevis]|uniref:hypothetical protein n=1 Tax=Millisia brevis TaxID=264148 RepID=UPI001FDEF8B8|nr:hypothetical protein [Millisia brevis]